MSQFTSANAFGFLLADCARLFQQMCDKKLSEADMGLSTDQIRVLDCVIQHRASTEWNLAARLAMTAMTLSASLEQLEKDGLIARVTGPDEHAIIVNPTAEGIAVFETVSPVLDDVIIQGLEAMGDAEIAILAGALIKICHNLTKHPDLLMSTDELIH